MVVCFGPGRSVEIPWPVPVLDGSDEESDEESETIERIQRFDGWKKPLEMSVCQLQFYALNGPGPCDMLAVLTERKKKS